MASGSNNQWEQYYNQSFFTPTPSNGGGFVSSNPNTSLNVVTDQSFVATSGTTTTSNNNGGGGMLTPTGSVAKPIRRRSRVSKKTPIKLLNANSTNFRALVQKFTGCAASTVPISTGGQKGPINLSFGANASTSQNTNSLFGNSNYRYDYQQHQQQLQRLSQVQHEQQHHHQFEEHHQNKGMYNFDNVNSNNDHVFHYSSNSSSPGYNPMQGGMEIEDGFEIMDQEDVSLHELLD